MTKVGFKNAVTFAKTVFLERKPTHRISLGNDVAKKILKLHYEWPYLNGISFIFLFPITFFVFLNWLVFVP